MKIVAGAGFPLVPDVIPAKAGTSVCLPAFAGMSGMGGALRSVGP